MKRLSAILLSLIMLFSSMGITYSTHYCMGRAVESKLMIGEHDLSCGMSEMDNACDSEVARFMAPGCCDNTTLSIETEEDYQKQAQKFSLDNSFLFAFSYTLLYSNSFNAEQSVAHSDHHPPPLEQDYLSLYQSFLL